MLEFSAILTRPRRPRDWPFGQRETWSRTTRLTMHTGPKATAAPSSIAPELSLQRFPVRCALAHVAERLSAGGLQLHSQT